ncbi:hypothetical protein BDV24DRAFT_141723 [Aspergillus arachidicola]|uniref:Uncharacterized protein n=1 Tax=Aspergillus arachidicola TaxID=656916 RepID=A0A5N6XTF6_9EURO|nr:hypothetical protein BDV24DRAFT_141723 [Aspergillus arachidicola]
MRLMSATSSTLYIMTVMHLSNHLCAANKLQHLYQPPQSDVSVPNASDRSTAASATAWNASIEGTTHPHPTQSPSTPFGQLISFPVMIRGQQCLASWSGVYISSRTPVLPSSSPSLNIPSRYQSNTLAGLAVYPGNLSGQP